MKNWVQEVLYKWKAEGVKLNHSATVAEIDQAELILKFKFPEDFKQFYLAANAFHDYEWQEHMFSFWSLQRIIDEFEDTKEKRFIGFCDFLICSHFIGFKTNEQGIFKLYPTVDDHHPESIAQSFQEVVNMINTRCDLIY